MNWLNQRVDIASLLFFRIAFGVMAVSEMIAQLTYKHWYKGYYDVDTFHFQYIGFEFVRPFPEPLMSIFLIFLTLVAFAILLGYRYRLSMGLFTLGYTYLYLMEKGLYLNHGYLFCWLSLVLFFMPAHGGFSLDVHQGRTARLEKIPYWPLFILCFLMGIVYFFGGCAKVNPDWMQGIPLNSWVGRKSDMPILGGLWGLKYTPLVMSYAGLILDISAAFLLMWKKSRKYIFGALVLFHLTNTILFNIGIFPWLSICLTSLFFASSWPRVSWHYIRNKYTWALKLDQWFAKQLPYQHQNSNSEHYDNRLELTSGGLALIVLLAVIHIGLPLRPYLFNSEVAWSEEGHRYSWRMMLRSKTGYGHFMVKEPGTDKEVKEKADKWMPAKMARKLYTHPDMIWQFSQHLAAHYREQGWKNPVVYAEIRTKLNDRRHQRYIDETVNLAAEKWTFFKHKSWILPLEEASPSVK